MADILRLPPSVHDFFRGYFEEYIRDAHQTYSKNDRSNSSSMSLIIYNTPTFEEFSAFSKSLHSNPNRMISGFIETVVAYTKTKNVSIADFIKREGEPTFYSAPAKWEEYLYTLDTDEKLRKVEDKLDEINNKVRKRRLQL